MRKSLAGYVSEYFSLSYDNADSDTIRERILSGGLVRGTNLCVLMLAIFIASIGLNMNSTAVIIGAMLISPLMGSIMAVGYCIATNDIKSALQFLVRLLLQVVISLITSFIYFTISPISTAHSELLARTNPTIWDVLIAFFGGLAGIIGTTRQEKSNVLPGVAIATALMPPLCTAGYGLSIRSWQFFVGAMYLFFINSFFICMSTIIILKIIKTPEHKNLSHRARKRVHKQLLVMACITVIPSIYLAYQTTLTSIKESRVDTYIQECFNFPNTEVIQSSIDEETNTIEVALLGETIDNKTIDDLESQLADYNLEGMSLKITQTQTNANVDNEKLKELVQSLINNNVDIASFKEFMSGIDISGEDTSSEETTDTIDLEKISKSIRSLYPQVKDCYIGYINDYADSETEDIIIVILSVEEKMSLDNYTRLESWLSIELDDREFMLLENIISEENVTEETTIADTSLEDTSFTDTTTE